MIASRALAAVVLVGAATLFSACTTEAPVTEVTPTDDSSVDAVDLEAGMCIVDESSATMVSSVEVVDCAEQHDAEIYATILLADGAFPGGDAIAQQAVDQCAVQFANFVGVAFASSALTYEYYAPSETTWNAGDREVLCLIRDPAGPVNGTLEGVAR